MLTAILIIAAIVIGFLVYANGKPSTFSMSRSATLNASPAKVFAQINDFHNWAAWSPWEKMDPNMTRSFSGESSGAGAKYSWVGNKKVGEGSMEITRSVPASNMQLDLHFLKPFKADNVTEFKLVPQGAATTINWEMRGNLNLMMKVMHIFMDMDKVVGKDFENGLANLKAIVEK
jgi:Polyketide cyclase / dehydrase and lipid transport